VVAGFVPKFNVPVGSVVDGLSSLLAAPKTLAVVGLETLVTVDVVGEPNRPTFAWLLLTVNMDPNTESEIVADDVELVAFTEGDTIVLPKVKMLLVVSTADGFETAITLFADEEMKVLLLLSDRDPWPGCSSKDGTMLFPLHAPSGVEEVTTCKASPADTFGNESGTFRDELDGESTG